MPKIAGTFEEIIASARGQIKAVVTTAEVCRPLLRHPVVYYALHNYVHGSSCSALVASCDLNMCHIPLCRSLKTAS